MTRLRWISLLLILAAALGLRVWRLDSLPDGFFCDEASLGYNAWAISRFGIDETGTHLPLYARSLGVKKNPVFVYASMIPINIFGLSVWSVRLTSAVFGVLTIAGVFWLVFLVMGSMPAFLAALFMAVLPWNFHFSRIAFELITWPCLFVWSLAFLLYSIRRGGWPWLVTGLLFGISLHSYVMAITFIPLFLPAFGLIYFKRLMPHWKWLLGGILVFALLVIPAVQHHYTTRSSEHYSYIGWWSQQADQPLKVKLQHLAENYVPFFEQDFLVTHGDPNPRHSIRNHGPIYRSLFYLSLAGLVVGLLPPSRFYWMLLTWTALYPLGSALTIDRYATRSIIGSPLGPIWAALAIGWLLRLLGHIPPKFLSRLLQTCAVVAGIGFVGLDVGPYFRQYFLHYNEQSAHGLYGFQYGYRETIEFMENRRKEFPQLILTAHNVNEPYVFCLFYNKFDPRIYADTHDFGYTIMRSFDYRGYNLNERTLFAIHPDELIYFDSYKLHHTVKGYNNTDIFYIIEPLVRRPAISEWALRGLRRRMPHEGCAGDYFDPGASYTTPIDSLTGKAGWTCPNPRPPVVDVQWHFRDADPEYPLNPEYVEAEGVCWTWFDREDTATVELFGSNDYFSLWLNGEQVMEPQQLEAEKLKMVPCHIRPGWNEWAFRACESFGDWYFVMTLRDSSGKALVPARSRIAPPGMDDHPPDSAAESGTSSARVPLEPDRESGTESLT